MVIDRGPVSVTIRSTISKVSSSGRRIIWRMWRRQPNIFPAIYFGLLMGICVSAGSMASPPLSYRDVGCGHPRL